MNINSIKAVIRPLILPIWGYSPLDRMSLWWNGARARSFQPRPVFRDTELFEAVPTSVGELLFAIPSSQGNFERAGVAAHNLDRLLHAVFQNGLVVSVLERSVKERSPWALRADENDAYSSHGLTDKAGIRFNSPDFVVHSSQTSRLTAAITQIGIFYIHRPVSEPNLSRAELLQGAAIEVDLWQKVRVNSAIHGSKYWNVTSAGIDIDAPAQTPAKFARRLPFTYPEFTRSGSEYVNFPIDLVYLWVDGADEEWLKIKESYVSDDETINHASKAKYRFREFDELRHSIRSVEAFAPWIRNIYIVTAGQRPKWLTEISDKIRVVDHSEIIPAEWLPTYSSHVIAAHLHHIDGIAEHFFYMNDDFFFSGQSVPERWFHPNGTALGHVARNRIPAESSVSGSKVVKAARRSTIATIQAHGFEASTRNLGHGPMPWRRSILIDAWNEFSEELTATGARRFRHEQDMIPDWLVALYGQATGDLIRMRYLRGRYVAMNKRASIRWLRALLRRSDYFDFFCLNDDDAKNTRRLVSDWYQPHRYRVIFAKLFPFPSRFEKSADR